jgi:hypothetical protein
MTSTSNVSLETEELNGIEVSSVLVATPKIGETNCIANTAPVNISFIYILIKN